MAAETKPEIILYDLACAKGVCFSPVVWRIRLMLNYKKIPYTTVFLEFPDIEPTLKEFGIVPNETNESEIKYTVPAIHHVPTNRYIMDSRPIAEFLETTYPDPSVLLQSELGTEIEARLRAAIGPTLLVSLVPREINILSSKAQGYFRRTREAQLGHRLEDLLDSEKEEEAWRAVDAELQAVSDLMYTHDAKGQFILGALPSYSDFFIAGALQCARVIEEEVFERNVKYPGLKKVYEGCLPYMEKRN